MEKIKVFQLTADQLTNIVKSATKAAISEFIQAASMAAQSIPASIAESNSNGHSVDGPVKNETARPWLICDTPGCLAPVREDDIYCEDHAGKKKRGRPAGKNIKKNTLSEKSTLSETATMSVENASGYLGRNIWFVYDQVKTGKLINIGTGLRKKITVASIRALAEELKK